MAERVQSPPEVQIIRWVFNCEAAEGSAQYEAASQRATHIKREIGRVSNDRLLGLFVDVTQDEGHLDDHHIVGMKSPSKPLADAFSAMAYLDSERAMRLYTDILTGTGMPVAAKRFLPTGLTHLTRATGDEALPLWHRVIGALDLPHDIRSSARAAGKGVLSALELNPETFSLSPDKARELSQIVLED